MDNATATNGTSNSKIRTCFATTPKDFSVLKHRFTDVFKSGLLSNFGKYNTMLEEAFRELIPVEYAFTVPNASTGLQILLSTIGRGAEVIVPSYTFPATVHAIVHAGHKPVFVDIASDSSFNMCMSSVRSAITSKTSAIIGVHSFGNPCAVDELQEIASEHDLKLFFDAAAALGSEFKGKMIGAFGDAEVFSLSGTKIVTAGEGGIITTNNAELAQQIKSLRNYGYSAEKNDCLHIGFNGKLDELSAILGLWNMQLIDDRLAWRETLARRYQDYLASIPGIRFQKVALGNKCNYSFFPIEIEPLKFGVPVAELVDELQSQAIQAICYFSPPVHKMTAYQDFASPLLPESERLSKRIICLPIHDSLHVNDVQRICRAIQEIHQHGITREKVVEADEYAHAITPSAVYSHANGTNGVSALNKLP